MKLRVGVVGLGQAWETRHAPALRALADRFEVRAFCDPVAHRAAEIAQRWPARTCDGAIEDVCNAAARTGQEAPGLRS